MGVPAKILDMTIRGGTPVYEEWSRRGDVADLSAPVNSVNVFGQTSNLSARGLSAWSELRAAAGA